MDIALLRILLKRARELEMTPSDVKKACWKHGHKKRLDELDDERATELAGKMKILLLQQEKTSVTMPHGQLVKSRNGAPVLNLSCVLNPMTGEETNIEDIDQLIETVLQVSHLLPRLKAFDQLLRKQALKLAKGEGQTRHLRGEKRSAVLENCGGVHPDMMVLLQAFESYPQFRQQLLRVERVALKSREFKAIDNLDTGDPLHKEFTTLLRRAVEEGAPVVPTLKVVKD